MSTTTTTTELKIYVQRGSGEPTEWRVDSTQAISNLLLQKDTPEEEEEEVDILFKDTLLLDQKESFQFYHIENESNVHIIKKQVNISVIESDNSNNNRVILEVSPHHTIMQVLQQHPLLKKQVTGHHHPLHFMCNGLLIEKENKERKTLYQLGIHDDVFISMEGTMVIIIHQQQPPPIQPLAPQLLKKKKNRCAFIHCSDKVCKVIGDCRYCQSSYCARHRLPEAHTCHNLTGCKRVAHERNSVKLLEERCVANKI